MSAQHTPGPWNTRPGSFGEKTREVFRKDKSIKKPFFPTEIAVVRIDDAAGRANAKLIAEAPEMLKALRTIAAITTCADQDPEAMCAEIQGICRVALAKVTGGAA